jgi:hypothetical protein
MQFKNLRRFALGLLSISSLVTATNLSHAANGTSQDPLHIVLIDACMMPESMDFLNGKHVVIELLTSAEPALKSLFTPEVCLIHYRKILGENGSIVSFHSRFLGHKLENEDHLKKILNSLVDKRGPINLVIANTSDLATYASALARKHLGLETGIWFLEQPNLFYNKLEMKEALVQNDPSVKTAPFIAFDAPWINIRSFVDKTPFPLILKKRRSAGSVGIKVINNEAEFIKTYSQVKDRDNLLIEQFIIGTTLRIQGERLNDKTLFYIPTFNRTSPLEHYQNGKNRIASTIDESEIPLTKIQDFADRVLNALRMHTGSYHLEAIYSDADHDLYFMEIAARPGEGNMDRVYKDLHGYVPRRAFYFKQFPEGYWNQQEQNPSAQIREELFGNATSRSKNGDVYAVLTYPFKDANRFTFQKVTTNLHPSNVTEMAKEFTTFKGCDFDEALTCADPTKLASQGVQVYRYAFQVCLRAISCSFSGPREQLEKDLINWQNKFKFEANPSLHFLNLLVPRKLLMAGGL